MICHQCLKPLNEMSLYCDRCGVKLPTEKVQFNFDTIDRYLLHPEKENVYPADLIVDIKKAYYLSTIIQEEHADNQDLIEKYLSYVYLRILYERDKNYLLTEEYSIPKAKAILTSLVSCKINKDMLDYLEEEFPEEMLHQTIPKEVLRNIDKPYITEHNIKKILPKKSKELKVPNKPVPKARFLTKFRLLALLFFIKIRFRCFSNIPNYQAIKKEPVE